MMRKERGLGPRRCTALRQDGEACRAWAVRPESGQWGPAAARCVAHGGNATEGKALGGGMLQDGRSGEGVLEPVVLEAQRETGLYDDCFSDEEYAALEGLEEEGSLSSELRMVRIVLRRLLLEEGQPMSGADVNQRALTLFKGAEVMAHLQESEKALQSSDGGIHPAVGKALDEISLEWGVDL